MKKKSLTTHNNFKTDISKNEKVSYEKDIGDTKEYDIIYDQKNILDIDEDTRSVISNVSQVSDIKEIFIKDVQKQSSKIPSFF